MIVYQNDLKGTKREVEIRDWALAEDLFVKWGYDVEQDSIEVEYLDDITLELSVWGIPWRRKTF